MDGLATALTFRVQHDCPLAAFSRTAPMTIQAWSGHHFEVLQIETIHWADVEIAAAALNPERVLQTKEGGLIVWRPSGNESITRLLERHGLMWLQPLTIKNGWEHYDALSFGDEQAALDELRKSHDTQVVRRTAVDSATVQASLFQSVRPVVEAPTQKQREAISMALELGYYESPRKVKTSDVAAALGIGRSAFEERLRAAENRIMHALHDNLR